MGSASSKADSYASVSRYSLKPHERKQITTEVLKKSFNGVISARRIRDLAKSRNTSIKVLHKIAVMNNITVDYDTSVKATAIRNAEQHFTKHISLPEPEPVEAAASDLDTLAEMEREHTTVYTDKIAALEKERASLKADVAARVEDITARMLEVERYRDVAKRAIQQTKALRQRTLHEREQLETLAGTLSSTKRQTLRLLAQKSALADELQTAKAIIRTLLKSLALSEADNILLHKAAHGMSVDETLATLGGGLEIG